MHAVRSLPFALACALITSAATALAGGPITSGIATSGNVAGPTYTESWTFSGSSGERVILVAVTTSGAVNTVVTLRAPGGALLLSTAADRSEFLLTSTGVHTIEVSDQGLNDAGAYTITYLNLTAGPLSHGGDLDGDAIASGEARAATIGTIADLDAFTFSGTAGERVLLGAIEGSLAPFNVTLTLYPPGGGGQVANSSGGNKLDVQLGATGTYTLVVEDIAEDHTGSYSVSYLNVSGGPHTFGSDLDGGAIVSATQATGTMDGVIDWDAFTFTGSVGDRIVVVALTTGGPMNTSVMLYPPGGGPLQINTAADRWDFQLTQAGTHTLVVEDQNFGETGTYKLALLNLTSGPLTSVGDTDGGALASGEVRAATIGTSADIDAFTFSGTAGQRVLLAAFEGSASPFNTTMWLFPPAGGSLETSTSGGNKIDHQLAATGTYTLVVQDIADDDTGNYTVSHLNVSGGPHTFGADTDGAAIVSATQATGTMNGVVDWDAFSFTGAIGDRIVVVALTTSGTMNTSVALYPPNGGTAQINTAADRWDFQLTQAGTHTLVVEDQNFGETGTYTLALLNLTSGPLTSVGDPDGAALASGEVRAATIGTATDIDAFTFSGTAGQRVLLGVLEGSAPPFNVTMWLYAPAGGAFEVSTSGNNRLDHQLAATGTYTLVVEDIADDHTGSYTVSHLNVSGGPHTFGPDLDGAAIASGTRTTGTMNGVIDWDAYTFSGTAGDRVVGVVIATAGAMNSSITLYPPDGGPAQVNTSADRWDFQLTQSGTHTLVVEDQSFGETGSYALTWLNVTAGPHTTVDDLDGEPIASNRVRAGTIGLAPDIDAFTFAGVPGSRLVIGCIATAGPSFNTTMRLYPPGGGLPLVVGSGSDEIGVFIPESGTWTILVEDLTNSFSGSYALSYVDWVNGPVVDADDLDGGNLWLGQVRNGTISPVPDFDVYWFHAEPGDVATVACVTTSGPLNTTTHLYPPVGGSAVVTTSADNWSYPITESGQYALLVQHSDLTQTGSYQLGLSGSLTPVVDVPAPPSVPARLALSAARPNPSSAGSAFTLELPRPGSVQVSVYDVHGARVRNLGTRIMEPGVHRLDWDGRDDRGRSLSGGVYLARVRADGEVFTRRIVRIP